MRTLPYSASVDHLRRQAKDLLATLRRTDPAATLADAQVTLARDYGYPSWPELKRAAEALRAAPTVVASDDVAGELTDRFGLGAATEPMVRTERIWAGWMWDLRTSAGRFVATELEDYVVPEDIDVEAVLVERAIEVGIQAPEPARAPDGAVTARIGDRSWRLHRWRRLGPVPTRPAPPEIASAAGRVLALLHGLALPAPKPVVHWLTDRPTPEMWEQLQRRCRTARSGWADALDEAVDGYHLFDDVLDSEDPNPRAILTHASLQPDAVRVAGADEIVVCGWEHASAVPREWEIAGAAFAWAERADLTLAVEPAAALLGSYRSAGGQVRPVELADFTAAVTGNVNWTFSRVAIALHEDSDAEQRNQAVRSVPGLLANPLTVDRLATFVAALPQQQG